MKHPSFYEFIEDPFIINRKVNIFTPFEELPLSFWVPFLFSTITNNDNMNNDDFFFFGSEIGFIF